MSDARELQYSVDLDTGGAKNEIDNITQSVEAMESAFGSAETRAQTFGAGAVSACSGAQDGARSFVADLDGVRDALDEAGSSAETAGDTTQQFGGGMREAGEEAAQLRERIRQTAEGAADLGEALRKTMAGGLEAGQSIGQSFKTGVTGALDFARKKVKTFTSDAVSGAKNIGNALRHPIQTIKTSLVSALRGAQDEIDDTGSSANDTERDLDDMGNAGDDAGNKVSQAIKSAVAAFAGFEVIKKGTELLKQFASAAVGAFKESETSAAQFNALFTSDAADWVDNYSDAVHRSASEVKAFMVENDAMYRNLGLTAEASEDLSKITTSLAYDFGNAFKMDDAAALSDIQNAIKGDTAALTKYGVILDDAALRQSALEMGLSGSIDSLDDATAAQVRLNAILMQSEAIQRAAVEQTDGLTNSTKSLKGVVSDFLVTAGERLAPAFESIVSSVLDSWPALEPVLLSFADTLGEGLSSVAPVLVQLGKNLIPSLASTLGTLMSAASPVLEILGSLAGAVLPPLASIISEVASTAIPPLVDIFETLNETAIQPLMPVIAEVANQLLPVLGIALTSVSSVVGPLISALMPLLTSVLPVLGSLISNLAGAAIPPLTEILGVLIGAIEPVVSVASEIVQAILPAAEPLISAVSTALSGVFLPAVEALSPALSFAADVLGTVAGWIADLIGFFTSGASKVVSWFAGLFGGAEESVGAVENLTGAVSDLDGAASSETSLAVDTSEYTANIASAAKESTNTVSDAITAASEITNTNYNLMASEAETAYASMTSAAEESWSRMSSAAEKGAVTIVAAFEKIAAAAQSVNSVSIGISGVSIPGNAQGTDDWQGGWTRMNEEGGELAYLPSGTAIIPADKTDEIINSSTSNTSVESSYVDSSTFSPQISITVGGGVSVDTDDLDSHVLAVLEKWYKEKKAAEYHNRAMQGAYAR